MARISVFGIGYVGSVSLACLADHNHYVQGVDINPLKVEMVNNGQSPVIEEGLTELLLKATASGKLSATLNSDEAIQTSDISFICVGTPSLLNGSINLHSIKTVCAEIGESLACKSTYHVVVVRSTILPGSMEDELIPILERYSGKKAGQDFGVVFNPEFLREGSSIKDFYDPPFTILAGTDSKSITLVSDLYSFIDAQLIVVPMRVAEMVKYACNAFHALKITFANEVGNICKVIDIDSHAVMDILCKDKKLNLSPYYLKPGFAFGGSCLPKDLRALLYHARKNDIDALVLESILPSNNNQIDIAYQMVKRTKEKQIGVLGLSFKAGTDELRESPMVELIEKLIGKGYQVCVYDKNVSISQLHGANRIYIEKEIPHIGAILKDSIDEVIDNSKVIIIGNHSEEFRSITKKTKPDQIMIDLVRIFCETDRIPLNYEGICW